MTTRILSHCLGVCLVAAAMINGAGCARAPESPRFQPYESVAQILADFAAHQNDDLYRFGYPHDIAGQNLFRATLQRIENYQKQYPGVFMDVLAVARGRLLERLGEYDAARRAYGNLGPEPLPELEAQSRQSLGLLEELTAAALREEDVSSLPRYINDLAHKRDELLRLADGRFAGNSYRTLALMEAEKADIRRAHFLFNNRYVLPGGLEYALRECAALIERHSESRLLHSHTLMLADFHFIAAKEYAALFDPSQLAFDDEEFNAYLDAAQALYLRVSQIDGAPEKLEAWAKLEAVQAFANHIRKLRQ